MTENQLNTLHFLSVIETFRMELFLISVQILCMLYFVVLSMYISLTDILSICFAWENEKKNFHEYNRCIPFDGEYDHITSGLEWAVVS